MLQAVRVTEATASEITKWDRFADALTELCNEHGIGLEGAFPYEMEQDDWLFSYRVADDGKLIRR